ncbi:MAG: glycoside hydrolase family 78 protein [Dysgonamonadaceae bacterium]|jgi:alpha-L-rhamnosidase|nr:glycoside hydrolase family 78 protein [Dysgonamonadaceae bacterium]
MTVQARQLQVSATGQIVFYDLRCENLVNPNAIDNTVPHFSWKIHCDNPTPPRCYEIQVATDSLSLTKNKADCWRQEKIPVTASVMMPYKGRPLKQRMLYYWRVRAKDEEGRLSDWSPIQRFGIGILEGLQGSYIGLSASNGDVRTPLLRKTFAFDASGTALLHVNSLGYHEVYLNGRKVDNRVLSPAVSQLNKRSLIVTYDVTPCLLQGENELVIWLGQGWYKKTTFGADYDGPLVKAELDVVQKGKPVILLSTDTSWTARESGYSDTGTWQALRFGGERIDARLLPGNLDKEGLDKLDWFPVIAIPVAGHIASPQMCEPNVIHETVTPIKIQSSTDGAWIVDMGKVLTGWFELRIPTLTAGREVAVAYTDDIRLDSAFRQGEQDIYIASGKPDEVFCNKFNHHAFRYVKITNLPQAPNIEQIKAYHIYGDYKAAASFVCSDPDLNAIHDMIRYTMTCLTFSGYMVDCPHLEREGYGGDGNSSTQSLQTMYDVSPTFLNWLQAWKDVMREDGSLPHVGPNPGNAGGGPYWCGFIVMAPWRTYLNYNDPRLIERYYDTMKQWFGYVDEYTVDGLLKRWPDLPYRNWYLGDWLAPEGVDSGNQASVDLVSNCFISECLDAMQKIATVLGKPKEAAEFAQRRSSLIQVIHKTFYHPETDTYATGSQLDMAYPMLVGATPDSLYAKVKNQLLTRSAEVYNGHIAVGLVGVPILTRWAIQNREADFMYSMLKKPDYPGYLYMINNHATTTWEYWNGERSRVHNCYNGIGNWFYQAVGGIVPDENEPGYRHIFIIPQIPKGVTWAKTTKESPYGTITVNWEIADDLLRLHIELPWGISATVKFGDSVIAVPEGKHEVELKVSG